MNALAAQGQPSGRCLFFLVPEVEHPQKCGQQPDEDADSSRDADCLPRIVVDVIVGGAPGGSLQGGRGTGALAPQHELD